MTDTVTDQSTSISDDTDNTPDTISSLIVNLSKHRLAIDGSLSEECAEILQKELGYEKDEYRIAIESLAPLPQKLGS